MVGDEDFMDRVWDQAAKLHAKDIGDVVDTTPEERERIHDAEDQVEAFLFILSRRYGVREDEIPQFVEAMRWAIARRAGIHRISWHALLGIVGAFAVGLALIMWEGFRRMLER